MAVALSDVMYTAENALDSSTVAANFHVCGSIAAVHMTDVELTCAPGVTGQYLYVYWPAPNLIGFYEIRAYIQGDTRLRSL